MALQDSFGRAFHYLRLSVDDACNFRCLYCLPNGYHKAEEQPPLSVDEIRRLALAFGELGFWKFRITGGEPTTRRDVVEIARAVASVPQARKVVLSTNGYRLYELASGLKQAGVAGVNVSVDSLERERFREIAGQDKLAAVLSGVGECLRLGLETKINVVLMKGLNEEELSRFLSLPRDLPLSVRFIELMPTSDNREFFEKRHLSAKALVERVLASGWQEREREPGDGPARRFRREGWRGGVGVIAPYSQDFCASCNRLRVTSRGGLRLCLFAEADFSLRPWLERDDQRETLKDVVRKTLARKEISHYLPEGKVGSARHFAMMGG